MVFFVRLRSFGHVAVHAGAARLSAETAAHAAEILTGLLTAHLSGHTVGAGCTALVIEREILGNIDLSVIVYLICYSSLN